METRSVHVIVEGRVQGVFFRASTAEEANRLGLSGWVRNRPDGTVETVIEGNAETVAEMIRWLHNGPPQATVTRVRVAEEPVSGQGKPLFTIHY